MPPASTPIRSTSGRPRTGRTCPRVAAAADAGDHRVRQPAPPPGTAPRLAADDGLEVADHQRERVRPDDRADDVVLGDVDGRRPHPLVEVLQLIALPRHAAWRRGWTAVRRAGTPCSSRTSAGQRNPLPLAAGQLPRPALDQMIDAEQLGRPVDSTPRSAFSNPSALSGKAMLAKTDLCGYSA